MIIDDPAPTLYTNDIRYVPSLSIQEFIEKCLDKNPETRLTCTEALNHPFLKRASSHQLLQKYLSQKPELNKRDYLMSRSVARQPANQFYNHDSDFDLEEEEDFNDSWDELDFINSIWNFNESDELVIPSAQHTIRPPPVHTKYLDRRVNPLTESPITPKDHEQVEEKEESIFHTRIVNYKNKRQHEQEFLMTKEYYY
jgi:serine/threonine protein kinase